MRDVALITATAAAARRAEVERLQRQGASPEVLREVEAACRNVEQALMLLAEDPAPEWRNQ